MLPGPTSDETPAPDPGARLASVRATELLDAEAEVSFDRLTSLARRLTGAPLAFMTVVDDLRSYWLSSAGLPPESPAQNTYEESFCQYVLGGEPLVLADVTLDDRTRHNPSIEAMGVRAWAGFPVRTPDGQVLGSFCVVDTALHDWTPDDVALLEDLAAIASREVALRVATADAERARAQATAEAERANLLARIGDLISAGLEPADVWQAITTLGVPALGDFAYVLVVEPGGVLEPVAARHRDPQGLRDLWTWVHATRRRVGEAAGAGLVALTGQIQMLGTDRNPGLTDAQLAVIDLLDVRESLVVPLMADGRVAAVLTIGRTGDSPPYTAADRSLVQALADRAGLVVDNALTYQDQRALSETLQRAMLPPQLPQPDHLHLVARYRPASRAQLVGGDWYDAFLDEDGITTLVIGDVAGHDIAAATAMGQLRTVVRVVGHDGTQDPAAVLTATDRLASSLGDPVFATALVAQVERFTTDEPARDRLVRWSNAGHPPPLLLAPDGTVTVLDERPGLPLGVDPGAPRAQHTARLPVAGTLLLYTDGLIESRSRDLDAGLQDLVDLLAGSTALDLEQLCDRITEELISGDGADDDIALIAIRAYSEEEPRPPQAGPNHLP